MKISVNWMLDHIATSISSIDVGLIVAKFNTRTAEIEHYEQFKLDVPNLFLARVESVAQSDCILWCDELACSINLSFRNDIQVNQLVLIRKNDEQFAWEALKTYSSTKEGLFPAVDCEQNLIAGEWKKYIEDVDCILDVDNKSINHRPDLWGHRGIAREVAAAMGWELKPLESMLIPVPQSVYDHEVDGSANKTLTVAIEDLTISPRIAALYCNKIENKASQIWMAMRLARVDSRPINTVVDCTNYVMFDISQPMHVFDAANFPDKKLVVRRAHNNEKLELLDETNITLTDQDIIVTDGKSPVAMAGVMGGKKSSFNQDATSIIIESGSFHASMVRNSATRIKHATEASTRFSKNLDPMQNTTALMRFLFLAYQAGVLDSVNEALISVGKIFNDEIISVSYSFIEKRLGTKVELEQIEAILKSLAFKLEIEKTDDDTIFYVTVPTYRTTKDITIPEDIVEEIARLYGFENIKYQRPARLMKSFDISVVEKTRSMKQHCAFAMKMHEVRDYLFYDESFLKRLGWYPQNSIAIKNPVSENWKVLVTSLVPHLIKNVELNIHNHERSNFFELNSVWTENSTIESSTSKASAGELIEHKSLAGLFFGEKDKTFYDYKADLVAFFTAFDVPVTWSKPTESIEPWFDQLQTADLMIEGVRIGRAGTLSSTFVRNVIKGKGFAFELNYHLLLAYPAVAKKFAPWSRYQTVSVDISMLIDSDRSADLISATIKNVDAVIDHVELVDFFEKESWGNKRSLTMRYRLCDFEKNITKDVIDTVTEKVQKSIMELGGEIR